MTEKILVHLESIVVNKPENWEEKTNEEKYRFLNSRICLFQPSVNAWEGIEVEVYPADNSIVKLD